MLGVSNSEMTSEARLLSRVYPSRANNHFCGVDRRRMRIRATARGRAGISRARLIRNCCQGVKGPGIERDKWAIRRKGYWFGQMGGQGLAMSTKSPEKWMESVSAQSQVNMMSIRDDSAD